MGGFERLFSEAVSVAEAAKKESTLFLFLVTVFHAPYFLSPGRDSIQMADVQQVRMEMEEDTLATLLYPVHLPRWRALLFAFRRHPSSVRKKLLLNYCEVDHAEADTLLRRGYGSLRPCDINKIRLLISPRESEDHVSDDDEEPQDIAELTSTLANQALEKKRARKRAYMRTYRAGMKRFKKSTASAFQAAAPCIL